MERDIYIEVTKAKIKIIKDKKTERIMFRSRVKWHIEGEKNNAYYNRDSFTNPLQTSAGEGAPQIPFAVVFTPGSPVLPIGISVRWRYQYKVLFTCVRRLRVHCKE